MIKANFSKHTLYFKQPARTSRGILNEKKLFIIKLYDDTNPQKIGLGEISPIPGLSKDPIPKLENKISEITTSINKGSFDFKKKLTDFPSIQFGLETAIKDLRAEQSGILFPSEFTSGKTCIPINGLIWMGDRIFMEEQIKEKIDQGFKCLKLKIGAIDFETEINILKKIRKKYSPETLELRVDANGAFHNDEALEKLNRLSEFKLHSIEQPIKAGQWEEMSKLCKISPLPIALDEELIETDTFKEKTELIKTICPQYIVLKPTLLGGFFSCKEWIQIAESNQVGWWITSALESNIGLNAISQWTAVQSYKGYQGLGTGSLYTNNFRSSLYLDGDKLYFSD